MMDRFTPPGGAADGAGLESTFPEVDIRFCRLDEYDGTECTITPATIGGGGSPYPAATSTGYQTAGSALVDDRTRVSGSMTSGSATVDTIPPSAAFIRRQEPSAFSAPNRSRKSAPAQMAPGRPRARARENRPAATRRTSSSSSTSSADPGDPEPPAGPGWRWASDASWRNFVKSITSRDFEHEVALERLHGGWPR
jgi:hypothetical protein